MTTASKPAYRGSLDPFEDIAAQLRDLGVIFTLTVQFGNEAKVAHSWHNLDEHDAAATNTAEIIHRELLERERTRRGQIEGGGGKS